MSTPYFESPGFPTPADLSKRKAWATWLTLTPEEKQVKVQDLMEKGVMTAEAAQQLGISRQTLNGVIQQLKAQGWRRASNVSPNEALRLAKQGLSMTKIVAELHPSSKHHVARCLKEAGWVNPWGKSFRRLQEQMKPLLKQDLKIKEISDRLGVPYSHALYAKYVLIKSEPEGTYPARYYRKRAGAGCKPQKSGQDST